MLPPRKVLVSLMNQDKIDNLGLDMETSIRVRIRFSFDGQSKLVSHIGIWDQINLKERIRSDRALSITGLLITRMVGHPSY